MRPTAFWTALVLLLILVGVVLLVRRFEGNLVFFPSRPWDVSLASFRAAEEIQFQSADNLTLSAVWFESTPSRAILLYCHGNAGNLSHRIPTADYWRREFQISVLLFDYRGYGRSDGKPSEEGIFQDTLAAFQEARRRGKEQPLIVYGRILGTVPAIRLAGTETLAGLVLDSTLASAREMARRMLPLPGIGLLTSFKLDNLQAIRKLKAPLLVFHGEKDSIVPLEQGQRVFAAAPEPKRLHILKGQGHNDSRIGEGFLNAFREFLEITPK